MNQDIQTQMETEFRETAGCRIMAIYSRLFDHFGPLNWWPGDSPFEVMVGAVLTQAVSWNNAARAVNNLKDAGLLSADALLETSRDDLAKHITPALYNRQKARKLHELASFIRVRYGGSLELMFGEKLDVLRPALLGIWGIGPETADSILLYAGQYPVFVVDAYTIRIFSRLELVAGPVKYQEMQLFLEKNTDPDIYLYNEYHALLVNLGKDYCRKTKPNCQGCPLKMQCGQGIKNM